jgi:alcohol dehydrogenase class IV
MFPISKAFEFDYRGSDIVYGRGRIRRLGERLEGYGLERALVVTGSHVGENSGVMEPLSAGLGDRLAAVFDETTPQKLGETVFEGIEAMRRAEPDVIVGVGGGSSLDIARQMSVFAADSGSLSDYRAAVERGELEPPDPDEPLTPVVVVPTTFAGADVSTVGSVEILGSEESPTGQPIRTGGSVAPEAMVYDPDLFETTPTGALAGSAMNGFDKGIETLYARDATPVTDATAIRGLRLLSEAFPRLPDDPEAMERAVVGIVLVQFDRQVSIVHAFGHGFAERYDIQQGLVHAVVVPHVLRYLFEHVDARRELLAEGLGIETESMDGDATAEAILEAVTAVRDSLDLPTRLRELDPVREEDLPAIARAIRADSGMANAPEALDPTADELEAVLREAW